MKVNKSKYDYILNVPHLLGALTQIQCNPSTDPDEIKRDVDDLLEVIHQNFKLKGRGAEVSVSSNKKIAKKTRQMYRRQVDKEAKRLAELVGNNLKPRPKWVPVSVWMFGLGIFLKGNYAQTKKSKKLYSKLRTIAEKISWKRGKI
jgi:hypothetical protein